MGEVPVPVPVDVQPKVDNTRSITSFADRKTALDVLKLVFQGKVKKDPNVFKPGFNLINDIDNPNFLDPEKDADTKMMVELRMVSELAAAGVVVRPDKVKVLYDFVLRSRNESTKDGKVNWDQFDRVIERAETGTHGFVKRGEGFVDGLTATQVAQAFIDGGLRLSNIAKLQPVPGSDERTIAMITNTKREVLMRMVGELTVANVDIPTDFNQIAVTYEQYKKGKAVIEGNLPNQSEKKSTYEQFLSDNPTVDIDPVMVESGDPRQYDIALRGFADRRFSEFRVKGRDITVVSMPMEKNQDRVGLKVRGDGVVSIALADGVSESPLGEVAVRLAVQGALDSMESVPPSPETFRAADGKVHSYTEQELTTLLRAKADKVRNQFPSDAKAYEETPVNQAAYTTLTVAQYDRANNKLRIGVMGDSPVTIIKANGEIRTHEASKNGQLSNAYNFRSSTEVYEDINLDQRDLVVISSDGISHVQLKKILEKQWEDGNPSLKSGKRRDVTLPGFIRSLLRERDLRVMITGAIEDDISMIVIDHGGSN